MSDDMIRHLVEKRQELADKVQKLQSTIYHLDQTLAVFGHQAGKRKAAYRVFQSGELIRRIGEAERAGVTTLAAITAHVMEAREMDHNDAKLKKRIYWSVKECRKRMNARGD